MRTGCISEIARSAPIGNADDGAIDSVYRTKNGSGGWLVNLSLLGEKRQGRTTADSVYRQVAEAYYRRDRRQPCVTQLFEVFSWC